MIPKVQPFNLSDWQIISNPKTPEVSYTHVAKPNVVPILLVAGIVVVSVCAIVIVVENNRLNRTVATMEADLIREREISQKLKRQIESCPGNSQFFNTKNIS
jgi:beta-lactamase regulating signal transducer with metallopeptidase domain